MLLNFTPGQPISWGIGNRARGTYDSHPGRLVRIEHNSIDDQGREGTVAVCIVRRQTLTGDFYLSVVRVLEVWIDPRAYAIEELDNVPMTALLAQMADSRRELFTRGQGIEIGSPVDDTAGSLQDAASATVSDDAPVGNLPF